MTTREQGQQAEALALTFLQDHNFTLLHQNYHCRFGEIDLIVRQEQLIVFVEVRFRRNPDFGGAIESITWHKQQKIIKTAEYYIHEHTGPDSMLDYRFDVIALSSLTLSPGNPEWIQNAW